MALTVDDSIKVKSRYEVISETGNLFIDERPQSQVEYRSNSYPNFENIVIKILIGINT